MKQYRYTVEKQNCTINGQTIVGFAYRPEREGRLPLVIFAHELCCTHRSGTPYAERLAEQGIAAYTFDFRGGSENSLSDGTPLQMSPMTEADDLAEVIREAQSWPFVDAEKIVVIGASQGGYAAAVRAAADPDALAGLVLMYPALLINHDLYEHFSSPDEIPNPFSVNGWIDVGRNYATDVWDYDVYGEMRKYPRPVLILHGSRDRTVDISFSERAAKSYPNAELHVIDGGRHGFFGRCFEDAMHWILLYLTRIGVLDADNQDETRA